MPAHACKALGLDAGLHWLRADELNSFAWPGYHLRPIPGRRGAYAYGVLPEALYENLRAKILHIREAGGGKPIVERD